MNIQNAIDIERVKSSITRYTSSNSQFLNEYLEVWDDKDPSFSFTKIQEVVETGKLTIDSPIDGTISQAVGSYCAMNQHYILMQSESGHYWIIVQMLGFIDMVIYDNCLVYFKSLFLANLAANKFEEALRFFDSLDSIKSEFQGFYIQHDRPFHFFYDQLKSLNYIYDIIDSKLLVNYDTYFKNSFIDQKRIPFLNDSIDLQDVNSIVHNRGFTLKPIIMSQPSTSASASALDCEWSKNAMREMESVIETTFTNPTLNREEYDLVLWIGITGQKRMWLEQIEGYKNILKRLSESFSKTLVIVDGWTSTLGTLSKDQKHIIQDEKIFYNIAVDAPDNIRIRSVIGLGYEEKVSICQDVDFFIANAGSGSIVPLRFCNKDGVLHSNKAVYSFPDKYGDYDQLVEYIEKDDIGIPVEHKGKFFDRADYHISWKLIFNSLADIINKRKGLKISTVDVDIKDFAYLENESRSPAIVYKELLKLSHRTHKNLYINSIRDIALVLKENGMIDAALEVMTEAHELRPSGEFIEEKINEFRKI